MSAHCARPLLSSLIGRYLILGLASLALSACAATYTRARVDQNPLPRLAKELSKKYTTRLVGDNHLEVRDTWVGHSILCLGWSTCHTNLDYHNGTLYAETYGRTIQPGFLFIPVTIDAGPGFFGALVRPWVEEQRKEVLTASRASIVEETHSGWRSLDERLGPQASRREPKSAKGRSSGNLGSGGRS